MLGGTHLLWIRNTINWSTPKLINWLSLCLESMYFSKFSCIHDEALFTRLRYVTFVMDSFLSIGGTRVSAVISSAIGSIE